MTVNERDFALVIGINRYAGLRTLEGAEQDAADFTAWLGDPDGGGVPEANVRTLIGSYDQQRAYDQYRPVIGEIDQALDDFVHACGTQQGRRLYFYFAGHGIGTQPDEVALLLASARPDRLNDNFGVREFRNQFIDSARFKELIIFLDCCRELNEPLSVRSSALNLRRDERNAPHVQYLVVYATGYGARAFEPTSADRGGRGLLTQALLTGLGGKAADDAGHVTADSLDSYVRKQIAVLARRNHLVQVAQSVASDPKLLLCTVAKRGQSTRRKPAYDSSPIQSESMNLPAEQRAIAMNHSSPSEADAAFGDLPTLLLRLARRIDHISLLTQRSIQLLGPETRDSVGSTVNDPDFPSIPVLSQIMDLEDGAIPLLGHSAVGVVSPLIVRAYEQWDQSGVLTHAEQVDLTRSAVRGALGAAKLLGGREVRVLLERSLRYATRLLDDLDDAVFLFDARRHLVWYHTPANHLAYYTQEWATLPQLKTNVHGLIMLMRDGQMTSMSIREIIVEGRSQRPLVHIVSIHHPGSERHHASLDQLRHLAEQAAQRAAIGGSQRPSDEQLALVATSAEAITALCVLVSKQTPEVVPLSLLPSFTPMKKNQYLHLRNWLANIGLDSDFRAIISQLLPALQDRSRLPRPREIITRDQFLGHMQDLGRLDDLEDLLSQQFLDQRPM